MTTNYTIVRKSTAFDLERKVNSNIRKGYAPIGGVSVYELITDDGNKVNMFCQAMVRRGEFDSDMDVVDDNKYNR